MWKAQAIFLRLLNQFCTGNWKAFHLGTSSFAEYKYAERAADDQSSPSDLKGDYCPAILGVWQHIPRQIWAVDRLALAPRLSPAVSNANTRFGVQASLALKELRVAQRAKLFACSINLQAGQKCIGSMPIINSHASNMDKPNQKCPNFRLPF